MVALIPVISSSEVQFWPGLIRIIKAFANYVLFTKVLYIFLYFLHSFPMLFGKCLLSASSKMFA